MSQEASTYQMSYEPVEDFSASQHWSMDTYADGLMDELFSDIDQILEGSGRLPSELVQPEYVSLQTITVPQIVLPLTLVPPPHEGSLQRSTEALSTVVADTAVVSRQQKSSKWFVIILLMAASATLALAAFLWLASYRELSQSEPQTPIPERQLQAKTDVDAKFIDYMQRALEVIDQKQAEANHRVAIAPTNQPPNNLATIPGPSNHSLIPRPPANVLERVYIPVYQPPAATSLTFPGLPATAYLPRTIAPTLPQVVVPRPAAPARPHLPPSRPVVPARPVPPQPVVVIPTRPSPSASSPAVATINNATHTLKGLLELGDKSAALFEVDGVTRRIQVGESIGATGWTLVEVANQQAVIRRNGEVRSIYVGQKL